ncbi:MAG TPA: Fic family protein [Baekduia sp.]|uniref:Fic family protein n=1 Tax=Baekduia sp. TaxID=2600305 RepID=UPI002B96746B|nr:Fic family protein [Baekduia sp.]HMJ36763.1 Fic family protein [Baekduia sp.]
MALALGDIDTARGREQVFRSQHPQSLKTLTEIARIQSTEASNAIERITAPPKRIRALVADKTTPENRSEAEIAGYRAVLDTIHSSAEAIPFRPTVVEQLHRDLYQFTGVPAGRWKSVDNSITEQEQDGTEMLRFRTVSAVDTPDAMNELHASFLSARDGHQHHPLLLIGAYIFDFLAIHPFRDGNGRMSRLLTLLALYQSGYEVGRFISLERLINESKETYYEALQAAGHGWHQGEHDLGPWLNYFLGVVAAAYNEFEERVGVVGGRGAKRASIEQYIRSSVSSEFTVGEVRQAAAGASDSYINKVFAELRDAGIIERIGSGRSAKWRRLRTEF